MITSLPLRLNHGMKYCRSFFLLALTIILAQSANASCNVSAAWTYTSHGDTVHFVSLDTSSLAHRYWTFGDGSAATTGLNQTHVYATSGTYTVCEHLYIPGTNPVCVDSFCSTITVGTPCRITASWTEVTHGDTVYFTARDSNTAAHHFWNFGDGSNYGSGITATHVYANAGTYHVCFYDYLPGTNCSDSFCANVTIASGCSITGAWTYTTHGDSVTFSGSGSNTTAHHYWNFGDGTTGSGYSLTHVYAGPGTYHVCQYVYIPNSNCYDSSCNTIVITSGCPTHVSWQYYAHGDTAYFYASSTDSTIRMDWNAGDSTYIFGTHPTHIYRQPGTYHVCLYAYIPGTTCLDSFCSTVIISGGCHITSAWTYTASNDSLQVVSADTNTAAHHIWTFGDGTYSSGISATHVYASPGTYHVCSYVYIPGTNCTDSTCNTVIVTSRCTLNAAWQYSTHGDSVQFYVSNTDSTVHRYWNFGDGSNYGIGINPVHVYTTAGTYHVCLYAYIPGTACSDSFCSTVVVGSGCHVSASWSYTVHGDTVFLTSADTASANHHIWTFGSTSNYASGTSVTHIYTGPGTYHICLFVYTPGTTCTDSSCNNVVITSTCTLNALWTSTSSSIGDTVHFHASNTDTTAHRYWNFGDGTTGTGTNPSHTYAQGGTYHVCLYAYIPGTSCTDSFCNNVTVSPGCNISSAWSYTVTGDSVHFVSSGTNTTAHYYWNYGDGTTGSGYSPSHTYAGPGTYHVCQFVYIPNSTCADSTCNTIVISAGCRTNAAWQSYTHGDTVYFYAANNDTTVHLDWNAGDGNYLFGQHPSHVYSQPGTYHVCLYAYVGNCLDSFCNNVVIGAGCSITASWSYTHTGDSMHFVSADSNTAAHHIWVFGDGSSGSGYDITHVYAGPGTYHVCEYVYIPGTNCTDSSCNNVIVDSTCTVNAAWTFYTVHDSVHFIAADTSSAVHFYWHFGDGSIGTGRTPWHGYANAATYHVCLYAYTGTNCIDSFCYIVTVGSPRVNSSWSYTVSGDTVYFTTVDTNSAANHYWSYGDGTTSIGFNSAHSYPAPGTYNVCYYVYIPNSNTYDSTCNTITINGTCNLAAAWNYVHSAGDTFHFYSTVQDSNTYMVWAFGDGTSTSGTYVSHTFPAPGTYHVCVMAYIPGTPCSDSLCVDVNTALGITDVGTYPTISLSPNPFNQYTIMNIDGPSSTYEVRIYDLVGQLIRTDHSVSHSVRIDRGSLTSGMYIYSVIAGNSVIGTGKMSVE